MTPALLAKARTATQSWLGVGTSCPVPSPPHPKARLASGPWEGCSKSGCSLGQGSGPTSLQDPSGPKG